MASAEYLASYNLTFYDYVRRKMRIGEFLPKELEEYAPYLAGLDRVEIIIPRACDEDGRYHRLLPPFLLPFKHYPAEEVASAFCNDCGQCTSASESTIKRWKRWWWGICGDFRMKALEWLRTTKLYPIIAATTETTLAHTLKAVLPRFWMSLILPTFTSEALSTFSHRL